MIFLWAVYFASYNMVYCYCYYCFILKSLKREHFVTPRKRRGAEWHTGQLPGPEEWNGMSLKLERTCSANLPKMCEGYINHCCCPFNSPAAVSFQHRPVDSPRFHVSDLCCCCFLLWAEFYTVCQSPERHTLEGPVEWDTKSDPSGEQLFFTNLLPQPLFCLSLFIFQPYSSSQALSRLRCFFVLFFFYPCISLQLHQQLPRLLAKFEHVRSPLFGEATLHLLTRSVLEWLAKPCQHPPSMHRSECAPNEHD